VARVVTYLKDLVSGSSLNIEKAMGLRQPQISIAMRTLCKMGWILECDVKGNREQAEGLFPADEYQ
jgi:predicted transcriptional regulator